MEQITKITIKPNVFTNLSNKLAFDTVYQLSIKYRYKKTLIIRGEKLFVPTIMRPEISVSCKNEKDLFWKQSN